MTSKKEEGEKEADQLIRSPETGNTCLILMAIGRTSTDLRGKILRGPFFVFRSAWSLALRLLFSIGWCGLAAVGQAASVHVIAPVHIAQRATLSKKPFNLGPECCLSRVTNLNVLTMNIVRWLHCHNFHVAKIYVWIDASYFCLPFLRVINFMKSTFCSQNGETKNTWADMIVEVQEPTCRH